MVTGGQLRRRSAHWLGAGPLLGLGSLAGSAVLGGAWEDVRGGRDGGGWSPGLLPLTQLQALGQVLSQPHKGSGKEVLIQLLQTQVPPRSLTRAV